MSTPTVEQPDATPTRKVTAAGAAGLGLAVVVVIASAAGVELPGVDVDTVSEAVGPLIAGLVPGVVAYLTRERSGSAGA